MSYTWSGTQYSFTELYDLEKGCEDGDKVAALQMNLGGLVIDGNFGKATDKRVRNWQDNHGLFVDGQAGAATQGKLITIKSRPAEVDHNLPTQLLKSLAKQESNLTLAARSNHPSDWGFDLGPFQNSIGPYGDPDDQAHLEFSYSITRMAERTAAIFESTRATLREAPYCEPGADAGWYGDHLKPLAQFRPWIYATQLAVLNHNWPGAADHLASHDTIFIEPGGDDKPRDWIIAATNGRLQTGREWVMDYIPRATQYIIW